MRPATTTPPRTDEQRAAALTAALAARQARATLRQDLKARRVSPADVVRGADDNPIWAGLRVSWLLECVPGLGEVRTSRLMESVGISPTRRVRGLGVHQREALLAALAGLA